MKIFHKTALTLQFLALYLMNCIALQPEHAQKIQTFISNKGSMNESVTITNDGKYKSKCAHSFLQKAIDQEKILFIKAPTKNLEKHGLTKFAKQINDSNFVIDISFENLLEIYTNYKKNNNSEIKFIQLQDEKLNLEHNKILEKIKNYFNDIDNNKNELSDLVFTCLFDFPEKAIYSSNAINDNKHVEFFKKNIRYMAKTKIGANRLKSLLLVKLLSFIKDNPFKLRNNYTRQMLIDEAKPNGALQKIIVATLIEEAYITSDFLSFDYDKYIETTKCYIDNGEQNILDIMKKEQDIRNASQLEVEGDQNIDANLQEIYYNHISATLVHELGHIYVQQLLSIDVSVNDCNYLLNKNLSQFYFPLLNEEIKASTFEELLKDENIKTLLNNQKFFCKTTYDLMDREMARAISANLIQEDLFTQFGIVGALISENEYIIIVDKNSENAFRDEMKLPYVFNHGRYKFCNEEDFKKANNAMESCNEIYKPFKMIFTKESGFYKVFEPYITAKSISIALQKHGHKMFYKDDFDIKYLPN